MKTEDKGIDYFLSDGIQTYIPFSTPPPPKKKKHVQPSADIFRVSCIYSSNAGLTKHTYTYANTVVAMRQIGKVVGF
jgi:hypothetical protein